LNDFPAGDNYDSGYPCVFQPLAVGAGLETCILDDIKIES